MTVIEDYSVIYIRTKTDNNTLAILEDKINDLMCDLAPISIVEVYDTPKEFENRYEDELVDEV